MPGDPTATNPPPQHVRVGRIGRAYQLEGGVRLLLEAGVSLEALRAAERLYVTGHGLARVRELRAHGGDAIVYLEGVRDRDGARALTGAEAYAPAAAVRPAAGEGRTLVGAPVRLGRRLLGTVRDVRASGGNPLLVVAPVDDASGAELLLPLAAPYVRVEGGEVHLVDPPEGLIEP